MDDKKNALMKITQDGFYVNAAMWATLGVLTWLRADNPLMVLVVCGLILGNALTLVWVGWGLGRRRKFFWLLGVALIGLNFVLTLTDQFGVMDLFVLVLNGALLALLVLIRGAYFKPVQG